VSEGERKKRPKDRGKWAGRRSETDRHQAVTHERETEKREKKALGFWDGGTTGSGRVSESGRAMLKPDSVIPIQRQ
jgi:hypothetical protein